MSGRLSALEDSFFTKRPAGARLPRHAIFLTGATGLLGMELLARYLERTDRHVYALVRPADDADNDERLRAVTEELSGNRDAFLARWTAVPGDIEAPGLGIEPARRRERIMPVLLDVDGYEASSRAQWGCSLALGR